jgi:hypothetical protein
LTIVGLELDVFKMAMEGPSGRSFGTAVRTNGSAINQPPS